MADFNKFKRAVTFLNNHCAESKSFEDVALSLSADRNNEFHDFDFILYICDLDNAIQDGLSEVLGVADPGVEEDQ